MDPYQNYEPNSGAAGQQTVRQPNAQPYDTGAGASQPYGAYPYTYQVVPPHPGKEKATTSMILGIISTVLLFGGYTSFVSVILGIVGVVMASGAKKLGYQGGERTAGLVLSLVGLIGGALVLIVAIAFIVWMIVGVFGSASYYSIF